MLRDGHQPRQRTSQFALGGLEFLECGGVIDQFWSGLDGGGLGARLDHLGQRVLLEFRFTLDRGDQVGHQVRAALVLVDDLGPTRLDLLVGGLRGVLAAAGEGQCRGEGQVCQYFSQTLFSKVSG